ncbi:DUF7167 family protein [Bacillus sp. FJAT-44742]
MNEDEMDEALNQAFKEWLWENIDFSYYINEED